MTWGDSWGSSPCNNAKRLAAAFWAGRNLKLGKSYVEYDPDLARMEYYCNGAFLAKHSLEHVIAPKLVTQKILGEYVRRDVEFKEMTFCVGYRTKVDARHLQALGVEAKWQWGGRPFLVFGAEWSPMEWMTAEEAKKQSKWEPPPVVPKPRHERFVNLTMPLFA